MPVLVPLDKNGYYTFVVKRLTDRKRRYPMKFCSHLVLYLLALLVAARLCLNNDYRPRPSRERTTPATRSHLGVRFCGYARGCPGLLRACWTAVGVQHAPNCRANRDRA